MGMDLLENLIETISLVLLMGIIVLLSPLLVMGLVSDKIEEESVRSSYDE